MAFPTHIIPLKEWNTPGLGFAIPYPAIRSYEDLVKTAFAATQKRPDMFNVHFHVDDDGRCGPLLVPFLWNTGRYFNVFCEQVPLIAHFSEKAPSPVAAPSIISEAGATLGIAVHTAQQTPVVQRNEPVIAQAALANPFQNVTEVQDSSSPADIHTTSAPPRLAVDAEQPPQSAAAPSRDPPSPNTHAGEAIPIQHVESSLPSSITSHGIKIGHAASHRCLDPNIRPSVYATLASGKGGSRILKCYTSSLHIAGTTSQTRGDVWIALSHVDLLPEYAEIEDAAERRKAIVERITDKVNEQKQKGKGKRRMGE